jgi:tetratricopeptide (TPR) repeat protein
MADSYSKLGRLLANGGNTVGAIENYHKGLTIFEALSANDRTNAELHRALADTYSKLAEAHTILAANTKSPADKRLAQWREARSWYEKSLELLTDMRNRGSLTGLDTRKPEEISRQIANCDNALARLGSRISAGDK